MKINIVNPLKKYGIIFILGWCFLFSSIAMGETWQSQPIFTGEMLSIVVDPFDKNTVYVGTRVAGVFKTINGGVSWEPARNGLTFYPIRTLIADPENNGTLYAGTDFDGVYKTTNGGVSWVKQSTGLKTSLVVLALVFDPGDSSIIYAGLAGGPGLTVGNIYKSINGGTSWLRRDQGITGGGSQFVNGIWPLAVSPDNSDIIYAGTTHEGVFTSTNGGISWSAVNSGIPVSGEYKESIDALGFNPHDGNLYAIIGFNGFYKLDSTATWVKIDTNWNVASGGSHLYFHPSNSMIIHAAGGRISHKFSSSSDKGVTWSQKLGHSESGSIGDIAFHSSEPSTIYAASGVGMSTRVGGVYKSIDLGESWTLVNQGITAGVNRCVAVAPSNSKIMFAGMDAGIIYRSTNGGGSWQNEDNSIGYGMVTDIKIDSTDSNKVYVASYDFYTSTDQGMTFSKTGPMEYPNCITIDPSSSMIFVGCRFSNGIYRSNNGLDWTQINTGLPAMPGGDLSNITSILADPNNASTVWCGTDWSGGILQSVNNGDSWQSMGLVSYQTISAIAIASGNSNMILAGIDTILYGGIIVKSIDGGLTWQEKLSGISSVTDIIFDINDSKTIYASTEGMGVFVSKDQGETWSSMNEGIFYPKVYDLDVSKKSPFFIMAASYGSGAYKYPLSQSSLPLGAIKLLLLND